jgi:hypothetical protein
VLAETSTQVRVQTARVPDASAVLQGLGLEITDLADASVAVRLNGLPPESINASLVRAGVPVRGFTVERPALEDLFVRLTGEGFDVVR